MHPGALLNWQEKDSPGSNGNTETQDSQNNLEKEQSWRTQTSQFQNTLQSRKNQNSMVLTWASLVAQW